MVGDDVFEFDNLYSDSLQESILYTSATVKTGQMLESSSKDGWIRRFRVGYPKGIGSTTEVFKQWELAAVAN